jgi:hypothetical protein
MFSPFFVRSATPVNVHDASLTNFVYQAGFDLDASATL